MGHKQLGTSEIVASSRSMPLHNVPRPDYSRFVGRDDELKRLRVLLSEEDRTFQVALVGVGGVGKSALALAIAIELIEQYDELQSSRRFDCIIWASAKEQVLTSQGVDRASVPHQVVHTLEDIYSRIASVLHMENITCVPAGEQAETVRRVLSEQRTLLIMDNFESLTDERIRPFLRDIPAPTKALITSREWFDVADVVRLTGLPDSEAHKLAMEEAHKRGWDLTVQQSARIVTVTHGLPLAIKLGVARYASGETFEAVERWLGDAEGEVTDYCVKGQVELAAKRHRYAREVLLACSLFDMESGVSTEALGHIVNVSIHDRDAAIRTLLHLLLVYPDEHKRYRMLPIVQRCARTEFAQHAPSDDRLIERWLGWLISFVEQVEDIELEVSGQVEIRPEYLSLCSAIRWCRDMERWKELYSLAEGTWSHAYTHSNFADYDEILTAAMEAADLTGDNRKRGRVELQRARQYLVQSGPNHPGLMDLLDSAVDKALQSKNDRDILVALYTKGHVLYKRGDLNGAERIANDLARRAVETGSLQYRFWSQYRISEVQAARQQFDDALERLREAENYAKDLRSTRLRAHVLHRRSAVLMSQNRLNDAEPILREALALDTERGELRYVANDMFGLAQVCAGMEGRDNEAVEFARQANALYRRLAMVEQIRESEALLKSLPT